MSSLKVVFRLSFSPLLSAFRDQWRRRLLPASAKLAPGQGMGKAILACGARSFPCPIPALLVAYAERDLGLWEPSLSLLAVQLRKEDILRFLVPEFLPRTVVQEKLIAMDIIFGHAGEVRSVGDVLPEEAVVVFHKGLLP